MNDNKFREDLFYRINVLPIRLPPLRERRECLLPLAEFLLDKIGRDLRKRVDTFAPDVKEAIRAYSWPGNIRQLANTIERALLLEDGPVITMENFYLPVEKEPLPAADPAPALEPASCPLNLKDSERQRIVAALEKSLWVQKDAAVLLGVSPRVLNHKIKKLGITHKHWRKNR